MEYLYIFLSILFALTGLAGAVLPVLPGPPLSFAALLLLLLCDGIEIGTMQLVIAGLFAVFVTILDYIAPVWFTKKFGGSKYGTWGATIGLFVGLFMGPLGIIICPFLGAFIGELANETPPTDAVKVAFMTFAAFMLTTGLKLVYGIYMFVMVLAEAWGFIWK
ncbi:MAG: DUF456 domain-containing protein [Bacteroidaceae bacterium]|nr:DUF456 domain-containing protein [Bacteroidaceae bacterium]